MPRGQPQELSARACATACGASFLLMAGFGLICAGGVLIGHQMAGVGAAMIAIGAVAFIGSGPCFCRLNRIVEEEKAGPPPPAPQPSAAPRPCGAGTHGAHGSHTDGGAQFTDGRMTTNAPYPGNHTGGHGEETVMVMVPPAPLPGFGLPPCGAGVAPGQYGFSQQQPTYPPPLYSQQQQPQPQLSSPAAAFGPSPDAYTYPVLGVPVALPPHQMGYQGQYPGAY